MKAKGRIGELERQLELHSRKMGQALSIFLSREVERSNRYHPFIGDLYRSIHEFTLRGGKRMASFTTALAAAGYGFEDREALDAVCEAVELYRHSILVHDDLVDGDDYRRGRPTLNRMYADLRDERLGLGCSVFSGNILFSHCLARVINSSMERDLAVLVEKELVRANSEVNESQVLDLYMEGMEVDQEAWRTMASKRAASLFRATLRIGGILPRAMGQLDLLGRAGEEMGYVFDIQDDIIDTLASKSEYGREPGSDIKTSKRPLHIVLAMERASPTERATLASASSDLEEIKRILLRTHAVEDAKKIADQHATRALGLIRSSKMSDEVKELFESLMAYMKDNLKWYE